MNKQTLGFNDIVVNKKDFLYKQHSHFLQS